MYKEYTNDTVSSNNLWALIIIFLVIILFAVLRMKTVVTTRKHTINLISVCVENY